MEATRRVSLPARFKEAMNFLRSCSVSRMQEQVCKQSVSAQLVFVVVWHALHMLWRIEMVFLK